MKKLLLIACYSVFTISCANDRTNKTVEIRFPEAKIISAERKIVDAELYRPLGLFIYKDKLVVCDNMNSSLFKVFDSRDLTYKYSFGSTGPGPNEFASHTLMPKDMNPSTYFEILDRTVLRYYAITDTAAFQVSSFSPMVHESGLINGFTKLSDSIYIFPNGLSAEKYEKEFIMFNINTKQFSEFEDVKFFDKSVELKSQEEQYFSLIKQIAAHPGNSKFAVFYSEKPYLKIFSSETLLGLYHIDSKVQPGSFKFFAHPLATDKYIYVLWIDQSEEEMMADIASLRPMLLIFDWDGNFIKNYRLDKPIHAFAINESNNRLYGVSPLEEDINAIYTCDFDISE